MNSLKDRLPTTITTDRLVLTTPTLAHVPQIAQLANNKRIHAVMSRLPFPYSEADGQFFVEQIVSSDAEMCWAVLLGGESFIGVVGLSFAEARAPELGYWLGEPHWGRGYASEAAQAVVAAARAAGAPSLRSRALLDNASSRNVLAKLGFTEIGEGTDKTGTLAGQTLMLVRLDFDR